MSIPPEYDPSHKQSGVESVTARRKQGLLTLWQDKYEGLSPHWKDKFLASPILDEILLYSNTDIVDAISKHKKLQNIVGALRGKPKAREMARRTPTNKTKKNHKKPKPSRYKPPPAKSMGELGFYGGLPRSQVPREKSGECAACGAAFGRDGRCSCS